MTTAHIASVDLLAVAPDGTQTPVSFRVGAPEQAPAGEWRCAIELHGMYEKLGPIYGEDSLQALCLALGLGASLLRDFVARGGRLLDGAPSEDADDAEWPLEAYFGWLVGGRKMDGAP